MAHEVLHEEGCDRRHTSRQRCNAPIAEARRAEKARARLEASERRSRTNGAPFDGVKPQLARGVSVVLKLAGGALVVIGALMAMYSNDPELPNELLPVGLAMAATGVVLFYASGPVSRTLRGGVAKNQ